MFCYAATAMHRASRAATVAITVATWLAAARVDRSDALPVEIARRLTDLSSNLTVSRAGLFELRVEIFVASLDESNASQPVRPLLLASNSNAPSADLWRIRPNATEATGIPDEKVVPEGAQRADVAWNPPATMIQGQGELIAASLLVPTPEMPASEVKTLLINALGQERPSRFGRVAVGPVAIANIVSDDPDAFKITPQDKFGQRQPVVVGRATAWRWHLVPLKAGRQVLRLFVYSPASTDIEFPSRPKTQEVDVAASHVFTAGQFWRRNETPIVGAIVVAVLAAIGFLLRSWWQRNGGPPKAT